MPPVNTPGLEYEVLFPAYLALKFLKNKAIKDFRLRSNVQGLEKFDDVLIDLEMENGDEHHFAIQLKHKERKDGKLTLDSFHMGRNFNLEKYCEAYHRLGSDKYKCIIFTNVTFDSKKIKDVKKFTMALSDNDFINNLLNSNIGNENVYKFKVNENTIREHDFEKFFKHFFLFVEQKNIHELEKEIKNIFLIEYAEKDDKVFTRFFNLFKKWHMRQFTNDTLDRKTLSIHLVDLLLVNFMMKPINGTIIRDKKLCLIEESIRTFDVTIIEESNLKLISELGKCEQENFLPPYMEELLKIHAYNIVGNDMVDQWISRLAKEYKLIHKSQKELHTHEKMMVFNYLLEKPLIINFNECSKDTILKVLEMDFKGEVNIKFVLLGKDVDQTQFGNLRSFKTLQDLHRCSNSLYEGIIKETEITLQGRGKIKLEEITKVSEEFEKNIQVKHLCQEDVKFGEELEVLPEYYIPRTVSALVLSEEEVLEEFIKKNCLLVVDYGTEYQYIEELAIREALEIININEFIENVKIIKEGSIEDKCLVVTKGMHIKQQFDKISSMIDNNVCLFKINKQRKFILIKSKNNGENGTPLKETEIPFNFCDGINVLCAEPGMGKTSSMKNLRNRSPFDHWAIFLEMRQFGSLFKKDNLESDEILERLLCEVNEDVMTKNMRNIFIKKRKLSLFLDGLDELDYKCVDNVLFFVKKLRWNGFSVWLSCRNNLKDKIETELNLFSFDINQVHLEQQREYINSRLKPHNYSEAQINQIINKIFASINIQNNSNILGIPLQLFMVTQTLIDDESNYSKLSENHFILTSLYSNYFKGKIKHALQKDGKVNESIFKRYIELILEQYEISGLRTCLSDEDFKNLNLSQNILEKDEIKDGDNYGIVKNVNKDKTVTFVHHTHAEYFAAIYLSQHFDKIKILEESFLAHKYDNLRLLFDIRVAENSSLHLSVLYDNLDQFNEQIANDDNINIRDKSGRTALHLVCTYGTRYSPLKCKKEGNTFYYDIPQSTKEEKESFKIMTDKLVKLYPSLTEDEIFKWNEFQYASKCWCLYPFEVILKKLEDSNQPLMERMWFPVRNFFKRNTFKKDLETFLNNNDGGAIAYYAAKLGYQNLMKILFVSSDFSINKIKYDQQRYTLLHTACIEGHKEIAHLLIKKKSHIDAVDLNGDTPLHYACLKGHNEIVNLLIQNKANVNIVNNYGYTPLNYAYQKSHQETVRLLIQNNDKEDTSNNNVLHDSCKRGHYQIVPFLVQNNANVNSVDKYGYTPLHWACKNGHKETAFVLIQNNANVNSVDGDGYTPLHEACRKGHKDIALLLIQNNANVNSVDKYGDTPLHWACKNGHKETAFLLIKNNANVNSVDGDGYTPLHEACRKGHKDIALLLIQNNANLNSVDDDGYTPLHEACLFGHKETALSLIENNANVNSVNKNGNTPLHWACKNGHKETALLLIQNNANINTVDKNGNTPLHWACKNGHKETALLLIQNNGNVNSIDKNGNTPLHEACRNGHNKTALLLIQNNANINSVNEDGDTPFQWAVKNGHSETTLLLIHSNKADFNNVNENVHVSLHCAHEIGCNENVLSSIQNVNNADKDGNTRLHYACKKGDYDTVFSLIQNGATVNSVNENGHTPLHYACRDGQNKIAKLLIENNANVNSVNKNSDTLLHYACRVGQSEIAKLLLENNGNVQSVNKNGETPLHYACRVGQNEIAKLLIEHKANVNSVNRDRDTPLHYACQKRHYEIAKLLIDNNGNVNSVNKDGDTPLHYACRIKHYENAKLLLENNGNVKSVNKNGDTPLHYACRVGQNEMAKLLIGYYANVNSVNNDGDTPLHYACRKGHYKIAKLLIHNKADIKSVNKNGNTPLHTACKNGQNEIVKLLIKNNAKVNSVNKNDGTPLHYACKRGHNKTVSLLIDSKADVNFIDVYYNTPLHYACEEGHNEIASLLIDKGAAVNRGNEYFNTPLHYASKNGHNEIASTLLKSGAEVYTVNEDGYTPLHYACSNGHKEIVELLIEHEANVNKVNKNGYTPLHYACKEGYKEIANLLIDKKADMNSINKNGETPLQLAQKYLKEELVTLLKSKE